MPDFPIKNKAIEAGVQASGAASHRGEDDEQSG
jgi:hypothetical protein